MAYSREIVWNKKIVEVFETIKEKPSTFTELTETLKMDNKSLTRYLDALEGLKIIIKNSDSFYIISQGSGYRNNNEYRVILKHNLELFKNKFGEREPYEKRYVNVEPDTDYYGIDDFGFRAIVGEIKPELLNHIKTGYPQLYKTYVEYFNFIEKYKKKMPKIPKLELYENISEKKFGKSLINKIRADSDYIKKEILFLEEKIKNGETLQGYCKLCPKVKIG